MNQETIKRIAQRMIDNNLELSKEGILDAINIDNNFCLELLNKNTTRSKKAFATSQYLTYMACNNQ